MRRVLAAVAVAFAGPAAATPELAFPTLADVVGVAAGDVLNVRARPDAKAPVVATLAPGAKGVEVVDLQRGWFRVALPEGGGWASARFLGAATRTWDDAGKLPAGLRCTGTEPFWSLRLEGGAAVWETTEGASRVAGARVLGTGFRHPHRAIVADGLVATIRPAQCSDGMSDRPYGLAASVVRGGALFDGCCALSR